MNDLENKKIDELIQKVEISIQQKSGADSEHKKYLMNIEETLKVQNERQLAFEMKMKPIGDAFQKSNEYKMVWKGTAMTIVKTGAWIGVVSAAGWTLWEGFKFIIKLAKI